jgi:hypothetical protein
VHPRGKVLDLADPAQRTKAIDEVWGPPHVRARKVAQVGGAGGGGAGVFQSCGECGGCDIPEVSGEAAVVLLVIIAAAIAAVILYYLVKWIAHAIRNYRARPRPNGAPWKLPRGRHSLRGKIREATLGPAPFTGTPCAAWAVTITHDRTTNGPVMLRDGATAGLTLELDDGRTAQIPAGRVRIAARGDEAKVSIDYLRSIDRDYHDIEAHGVIVVDEGHEVRLAIGDAVEIVGGLEERFDPNAPGGYREAPATQLILSGTPTLVPV